MESPKTPLRHATENSNEPLIKALIQSGADVNVFDSHGRTPIHNAIQYDDDAEIIELLVKHDADLNIRNIEGKTAYSYCC